MRQLSGRDFNCYVVYVEIEAQRFQVYLGHKCGLQRCELRWKSESRRRLDRMSQFTQTYTDFEINGFNG